MLQTFVLLFSWTAATSNMLNWKWLCFVLANLGLVNGKISTIIVVMQNRKSMVWLAERAQNSEKINQKLVLVLGLMAAKT